MPIWYYTWGCTYFGFSRFLDFLKNIFGKMQSGADGEGKYPTMEGGYDICLFGVAAGEGIYVGVWIFGFF